jgi:hypothetical protein
MTFTYGEQIAIAIAYAMRNNIEPLKTVLDDLRENGYDDYTIGQMFMDIGKIVFNENEIIDETEGELQEMKQAAIAGERDKIVQLMASKICFDFMKLGKCDHSACYEITDIIIRINNREHLA